MIGSKTDNRKDIVGVYEKTTASMETSYKRLQRRGNAKQYELWPVNEATGRNTPNRSLEVRSWIVTPTDIRMGGATFRSHHTVKRPSPKLSINTAVEL